MAISSILLRGVLARNDDDTLVLFVPKYGERAAISKDMDGMWETVDAMDATIRIPRDYFPELKSDDKPIGVRCMVSVIPGKLEDGYDSQIVCL